MFGENKEKFEMRGQYTPDNSALVLIDYQVGTLQLIRNVSSDVSLRNAVMLVKAAERLKMPIVFTTSQEDQIQGPLAPELQHASPAAFKARVKRVGIVNAWSDPKFSGAVEGTGRKNLIMGGVTTDICLIFPSISAVQLGFTVQAVIDASGSSYDLQEEMSRRRMEQTGVVLTTTNTVIAELVQDWATPAGMELVKLLVATAPMMQTAN
jgi:nicotinamidase-related amidase